MKIPISVQLRQNQPADSHDHIDEIKVTPAPIDSPQKRLTGLGYFLLFVSAIAFISISISIQQGWFNDIRTAKAAAAESTRPANVRITVLTADTCDRCYNVNNLINGITQSQKAKIIETRTVDYTSLEGTTLVKQYNLGRVPAVILQGEPAKLVASVPQLKSFGSLQGADFVGSNLPAPYVETDSGTIRGEFNALYLTEKQCAECYDPADNRTALGQLGMVPKEEKTVDRSDPEGQKLVKQYSLTTTPTVILTGDLAAYTGFDKVWENVGTKEADGAYVFRQGQALMGTYYDLTTKQAVVPPKTANPNTNSSNQ